MRLRLFRPLKGWRAFLGEVGVVVLGVLLALLAQQIAEAWQWRRDVAGQRSALKEMAKANLNVDAFRGLQEPCFERRLDEIQTIFRLHHRGQPIRLLGPVGLPYTWGSDLTAWDIALSDASLSHMPLAERIAFGDAVDNYDNLERLIKQEYAVWLRLQPLDEPDLLETQDWALLRQAYGEARALDARIKTVIGMVLTSTNLGLATPRIERNEIPTDEEWGNAFCRPMLASRPSV